MLQALQVETSKVKKKKYQKVVHQERDCAMCAEMQRCWTPCVTQRWAHKFLNLRQYKKIVFFQSCSTVVKLIIKASNQSLFFFCLLSPLLLCLGGPVRLPTRGGRENPRCTLATTLAGNSPLWHTRPSHFASVAFRQLIRHPPPQPDLDVLSTADSICNKEFL